MDRRDEEIEGLLEELNATLAESIARFGKLARILPQELADQKCKFREDRQLATEQSLLVACQSGTGLEEQAMLGINIDVLPAGQHAPLASSTGPRRS